MHLNEDIAVCEPIDIGGLPVADGTPAAKLLVTNVVNRVLPLIRYELTDEVTFLAEPNPDPWTGRRIADVQGRLDDMFTYATGVVVHPHVFRSALGRRQGILDYQVRQLPRGADIAIRTTEPVNLQDLTGELVGVLTHLGLGHPEVSIRVVADFNRQAGTGKLRRFVPLS
jgi:phenylacetate-coenzyme A ligase PaaK-like adenylate-forming protein